MQLNLNLIWNLILNNDGEIDIDYFKKNLFPLSKFFSENRLQYIFLKIFKENNFKENKLTKKLNKQIHLQNLKTILLFETGIRISKKLIENDINHVFLKGFGIVPDIANINKRPMRDIDILIEPNDINRSVEILKRLDFKFKNDICPSDYILNNGYNYDLPPMLNNEGLVVEIHYKINPMSKNSPCLLGEDMLKDKILKKTYNSEIAICTLDHLILHFIYHFIIKNYFSDGPFFINDMNLIFGRFDIDISKLLHYSELYELKKECLLVLNLLSEKHSYIKEYLSMNDYEINSEIIRNSKYLLLTRKSRKEIDNLIYEKTILKKLKVLIKHLFINRELISREFNINKRNPFILFFYPLRWFRQFNYFFLDYIKNRINKNNEMTDAMISVNKYLNQ